MEYGKGLALQLTEQLKPKHWEQLDRLFHSALERAPDERAAFLDQACIGHDSLRKQVEALLAAHENAGSFIENPAFEVEAQALASEQARHEDNSIVGQAIGHYRIIERLGTGGMGDVYLAQDTSLGRQVALKLLPAHFAGDVERLRRFEQEARAASALNHPNILTIYEIGQTDSVRYIATEFIDGVTLREHMAGKPKNAGEALDVGLQVASALAAAHARGIVHRDIKPENIMISRSGHLAQRETHTKVLDFGIAKLTEPYLPDAEMPTRALVSTSQGVTMGTAPYMSPEQVCGERVDARTDIWSLGVVVYEMLTGELPFTGEKAQEISASILKDEPLPLPPELPDGLKWLVKKALRKNREDRYQTARELFSDLVDLQQERIERESLVHPKPLASSAGARAESEQLIVTSAQEAATRGGFAPRSTSSAEYIIDKIKGHKLVTVITLTTILVTAGIVFGFYEFLGRRSVAPFQTIKITKVTGLTSADLMTFRPAISPDGKYVAYVPADSGQQSLWIRQLAATSNVQLVPPADVQYRGETFSPDTNYIYYVVVGKDDPQGALYQIPVLGAAPRKLLTNLQSPVTFSPDGKRIAFYRRNSEHKEDLLMVANSDGTREQKLTSRKGGDWFNYDGPPAPGPAWSPDGKLIACGAGSDSDLVPVTVVVVQVKDGTQTEITSKRWDDIGRLTWLGDGSGLLLPGQGQVWYLSYPGGEARKITNDFHAYQDFSLTADSRTLIAFQFNLATNIWIAPNADASRAKQLTSSNDAGGSGGLSWTLDGRIVYHSWVSGDDEIWIMEQDGSHQKQLTINGGWLPAVTADGRYVVFVRDDGLWRMDIDGGNAKQLTKGDNGSPSCSPDSKWVIYTNRVSSEPTLWKVSIDGGDPVQLTDKYSQFPAVSPDGKYVACLYWDEQSGSPRRIAVIPFEGGQPLKLLDFPQNRIALQHLRWTSDGRAITYVAGRAGVANIWAQPLDGGTAKQLIDFKTDGVFSYDWSRDGKQLACARGGWVNSIVLISDSKDRQ